jgi:hypothetical protein
MKSAGVTFNLTPSLSEDCGTNGIESVEATREGAGVLPPHDLTIRRLEIGMSFRKGYREQIIPKIATLRTQKNHLHVDRTIWKPIYRSGQ